jgi:copper chaperone CopZ
VSITTHTFRVEGMHCGSCALLIDDTLSDLPGVRGTQTTVKPSRSTVELEATQTNPEDVITAIVTLGYRAEELL